MTGQRAVFLDRDGTLIEDPGFVRGPEDVHLLSGAAQSVARLNAAGLATVVVTNQSGIARGLLTTEQYSATEQRLDQLLAQQGARMDAHYFCPHHPDITGSCECRKPGLLLYQQAAEQLGIELAASWWIGDRLRDVEPAQALGGRGILVLTGAGGEEAQRPEAQPFSVCPDLAAAVSEIIATL